MRSLAVISPHHPYPPRFPNRRRALSLTSTPREQLRSLLDGTASYQKHKTRIVMEPHTFRAMLLLLYGAGLRVSEALSLNLADVDLQQAVIVIRDTKFFKTRLVPLGGDLNDVM